MANKKLERDLGLYSVLTISIGAMVGSGIFVLPALAAKLAGPAVVVAYFLAGMIVLPAALSKAEMATAMPESGGTYLYIDRGMGPLMGTIAGLGTWFSLVFKSSFALVGLGAYLILFVDLPTTPVALGLAAFLTAINIFGVKKTGRLQAILVTVVMLIIGSYVATGLTHIDGNNLDPFFAEGTGGVLAATGFVFVSYAGVTKVASIAEEVENPGRNIPIGILGSVSIMIVMYSLVVLVTVGVTSPEDLGIADKISKTVDSTHLTPIAQAAENFLGHWGGIIMAVTAVLALASMANAGILSSSRYPLAMSRDRLAPKAFRSIHPKFGTPMMAILLTGGLILGLIAFVPVIQLAKLASAFKICVFSIINVALIAFRESELDWYEPEFETPFYPWVQIFGIVAGLALLTQMGMVAWIGAGAILVVGILWFKFYGRAKVEREGAAVDALRRTAKEYVVDRTRTSMAGEEYGVLLPLGPEGYEEKEEALLKLASSVTLRKPAKIQVVRFQELPDQTLLSSATEETPEDTEFDRLTGSLAEHLDVPVEATTVVSHDTRRALVNFAKSEHTDLILADWEENFFRRNRPGSDVDWLMKHAPCDLLFVQDRGFDDEAIDDIAVVADSEAYDPLQIKVAKAIAQRTGATVRLLYGSKPLPGGNQTDNEAKLQDSGETPKGESIQNYLQGIVEVTALSMDYLIVEDEDRTEALLEAVGEADLVIARESSDHMLRDVVFGDVPDEIAEQVQCTALLPYSHKTRTHTFLRYLLEKILY